MTAWTPAGFVLFDAGAGLDRQQQVFDLALLHPDFTGDPDPRHISTSYVERQNLTMRMSMRRFTRLTNAFSKKIDNLRHAVALNYMHYNFCRIHQTLRVTPAMEAGIADHVWSLEELVGLLERRAERAAA